jgi:hypothetical protein
VFEIDESIGGPKLFVQLFSGYNLPGVFDQDMQDLERLRAKPNLDSVFIEFSGPGP